MLALVVAFFAVQAGYQGFTAALPVALVKAGLPDAEIGLIVGVASVVQVPAAFLAGGLIDRFGGPRVLLLGALAYLGGAVLLTLPMAAPGAVGAVPFFVAARVLQGIGVSTCTPAAFAIVPGLVDRSRVGVGLAQAGAAQNLTMAFLPPVSLFVLDAVGLQGVAAGIAVVVAVGAVLTVLLGRSLAARGDTGMARDGAGAGAAEATRARWLGFAWRSAWTLPLLIVVAMTVHWGVVTSYLAQVAEPAGVNVGIFFTLDAVGVLVLRIPVGWLVDRVPPRPFLLAGIVGLLACVSLTLLPPTLPTLIVAGFLAGAGGVLSRPGPAQRPRRPAGCRRRDTRRRLTVVRSPGCAFIRTRRDSSRWWSHSRWASSGSSWPGRSTRRCRTSTRSRRSSARTAST
jgi:MFS family permease